MSRINRGTLQAFDSQLFFKLNRLCSHREKFPGQQRQPGACLDSAKACFGGDFSIRVAHSGMFFKTSCVGMGFRHQGAFACPKSPSIRDSPLENGKLNSLFLKGSVDILNGIHRHAVYFSPHATKSDPKLFGSYAQSDTSHWARPGVSQKNPARLVAGRESKPNMTRTD